MALTKEKKAEVVKTYGSHDKDTGSPEVQISLLTQRINMLEGHFKIHKKDHHSRQGLLKLVSQRRSLLNYLKKSSEKRYNELLNKLGIRK
jgi:small subunit ribosomal protein S15